MGFLKGAAKGISGFVFVILVALLLMNITLYVSTTPTFIKPLFLDIFSKSIASQDITPVYGDALNSCKTQTSYSPPMGNISITLNCSAIKSSSKENFPTLITEALFDQQVYGRQCNGLDCLQMQDIPGFATKSFNQFLLRTLYEIILSVLLFGLFVVLLSKGWPSKLSSLGVPLIVNGLPGIFLEFYKQRIQVGDFQVFIDAIMTLISKCMLLTLALGILLLAASIFIKVKLRGKVKKEKKSKNNKKKREK